MSKENPITWVCRDCGSEIVEVDAIALWDKEKQEWRFQLSQSEGYCCCFCTDCHCTHAVEKPITDLKTIARVAIHNNTTYSEDNHDNSNASTTG